MKLYWPFYIRRSYKVHVFSILYGHINVPMAFKELTLSLVGSDVSIGLYDFILSFSIRR